MLLADVGPYHVFYKIHIFDRDAQVYDEHGWWLPHRVCYKSRKARARYMEETALPRVIAWRAEHGYSTNIRWADDWRGFAYPPPTEMPSDPQEIAYQQLLHLYSHIVEMKKHPEPGAPAEPSYEAELAVLKRLRKARKLAAKQAEAEAKAEAQAKAEAEAQAKAWAEAQAARRAARRPVGSSK